MIWKQKIKNNFCSNSIVDFLTEVNRVDGDFLSPSEKHLHSPYLLGNIEKARDIIVEAVLKNKKISIFSDCDPDGELSTEEMYSYLKKFTENVVYFYEQREKGHGIEVAIHKIPEGTELLIIVDSSSSSVEACKQVVDQGIPIVILDHHDASIPNPYATIVNPQLDSYPNKFLSGAGVVWKMCQVLDDYFDTDYAEELIDRAGFGIHGDQMSMREMENRYILSQALKQINNKGIKALLTEKGADINNLVSSDISFTLTPLLNGAARMGQIQLCLELLTCGDEIRCKELAKTIIKLNEERKKKQKYFLVKFNPMIDESQKALIVVDDEIDKSFNGLLAGDIANKYHRPTIVFNPVVDENGEIKLQGSLRSFGDFDFKSFLQKCPYVEYVAGHAGAAGVGIVETNLSKFQSWLDWNMQLEEPVKEYICEIDWGVVDEDFIADVRTFDRLCGKDVPPTKFLFKNFFVGAKSLIGKNKDTIRIQDSEKPTEGSFTLMKFRTDEDYYNEIPILTEIDVIGTPVLNVWKYYDRGRKRWVEKRTKQIIIDDWRLSQI